MGGRPFTDEERTTIVRLIAAGRSFREVADVVGRSYPAIRSYASKFGLKALPEATERARLEGIRKAVARPEHKARLVELCRVNAAFNKAHRQAELRAFGLRQVRFLNDPEIRRSSDAKRLAALAKRNQERMSWLPARWRDQYVRWRSQHGAAMARQMVLDAERDRIAALDPFERQLERVRAGARVVERYVPPAAQYGYSLCGSSMGDMG